MNRSFRTTKEEHAVSEQREMSGILSRNKRKEKDSHPTHKGSATIRGEHFWVSAWVKEGRDGKFLSLQFEPKETAVEYPTRAMRRTDV